MSPKNIALAVSGGLVVVAILALFVEVRKAPAAPNPAKIDEARKNAKRTRIPPPSTVDDPWARGAMPTPTPTREPDPPPPPAVAPAPPMAPARTAQAAATPDLDGDPRLEISQQKDEANRLYDKMEYEESLKQALAVLEKQPGDIRMLRVVVSSACQLGDVDKAKQFWQQLPPHDQNQMARRCQRFGITFE